MKAAFCPKVGRGCRGCGSGQRSGCGRGDRLRIHHQRSRSRCAAGIIAVSAVDGCHRVAARGQAGSGIGRRSAGIQRARAKLRASGLSPQFAGFGA